MSGVGEHLTLFIKKISRNIWLLKKISVTLQHNNKKQINMKNDRIFDAYKKKADFLMNYQLCRAYLEENCGVSRIVELIMVDKYGNKFVNDERNMRRFINTIRAAKGKRGAVINIPRIGFKNTVEGVLSNFVEKKFDRMVSSVKTNLGSYPVSFRDIVERTK